MTRVRYNTTMPRIYISIFSATWLVEIMQYCVMIKYTNHDARKYNHFTSARWCYSGHVEQEIKFYRVNLIGVSDIGWTLSGWQQNPVGVTQYWNSIGVCWAIGIQFGVVLEGFRGLNDFFIRLGVTTEFCRGDKNDPNVFGVHPDPSGCNPEQPRATPIGAVMKGVRKKPFHVKHRYASHKRWKAL